MRIRVGLYKVISTLLLCVFIFSLTVNVYSINTDVSKIHKEVKHVLLISSYSPSFQSFFPQIEGLKSQFDTKDIVLDVEFMDTKRLYTEDNINYFYNHLKYKLANLPRYDGIIVSVITSYSIHYTKLYD